MMPVGLSVLGTTLFFALVVLLQWSHRRAANRARIRRGLREYVTCEVTVVQIRSNVPAPVCLAGRISLGVK
jgi:hypothetical protein